MIELVLKNRSSPTKKHRMCWKYDEPTHDEIEALGFLSVSPDGGMKMDSQVALKYIPLLAGIPRSFAADDEAGYFQGRHDCNAFLPAWRRKRAPKRFYNVAWFWKLNPLNFRRTAISPLCC